MTQAFKNANNGGFADWWQEEIDEAADIWNDDGGADFSLRSRSYSTHYWYKKRRIYDQRPGVTTTEWTAPDDCRLVDVDSLFNTRYTFAVCDDCENDEWDVKHVAAHEFGHWLVLTGSYWRFTCVMYPKDGPDYTLCNHEKGHMQEIYGED